MSTNTSAESMQHEGQYIYKGEPITIEGVTYHGIEIDKKLQFANPYQVTVYVESLPRAEDFIYDVLGDVKGTKVLYAQQQGVTSFFGHNPASQRGYGGAPFELWVRDPMTGEVQATTIKGPWSSRASIMNKYLIARNEDIETQVTEAGFRVHDYKKMSVSGAAHYRGVTVETLLKLLRHFTSLKDDTPKGEVFRVICASHKDGEVSYGITDEEAIDTDQVKFFGDTLELVITPDLVPDVQLYESRG